MLKKSTVVMLPTKEKALLYTDRYGNLKTHNTLSTLPLDSIGSNYHLYFLSDDKIKEGDWFVSELNHVWQHNGVVEPSKLSKKIIATTEIRLGTSEYSERYKESYFNPLPQPSKGFVEKYILEYDKGNIITEVMVEYEHVNITKQEDYQYQNGHSNLNYIWRLKVDKNNCITIKAIKSNWTKQEVLEFAEKYARMVQEKPIQANGYKLIHNRKWIEENL